MNLENIKKYLQKNNILLPIIVSLLILVGGYLRLENIHNQASYWNDESQVAIYARAITQHGTPVNDVGYNTGLYQSALYFITALSFKLFGINEFAGRLPSVIVGTILIGVIYVITKKMVNKSAALFAASLMAFSQIQLAWSTQLRPYIWLELFTMIIIYLGYRSLQTTRKLIDRYMVLGFMLTGLTFLFHGTGLINGIILGSIFLYKCIIEKKYKYITALIPIAVIMLIAIRLTPFWEILFRFNTYLVHYKVFFTYHYLWLGIGTFLGAIVLWFKDKKLFFILTGSIVLIISIALFKINDRYVRYSLPAFPLLYILFGIGVNGATDYIISNILKFKKTNKIYWTSYILIFCSISAILVAWPIKKDKIIFTPRIYYSINADMRENPIVDYKSAFNKISQLINDKKNVIVMDAWNDRVPWYLPGQKFVFLNVYGKGEIDEVYGEKVLGSIALFEAERKQYNSGIVIIENWESFTTEELKNHVRNTLKHEFDQETVEGNEADSWSISVYSWGI